MLDWDALELTNTLGFVVMRSEDKESFSPLSGLIKTEMSYKDKEVSGGNTYYYQIRIYTKEGKYSSTKSYTVKVK